MTETEVIVATIGLFIVAMMSAMKLEADYYKRRLKEVCAENDRLILLLYGRR